MASHGVAWRGLPAPASDGQVNYGLVVVLPVVVVALAGLLALRRKLAGD